MTVSDLRVLVNNLDEYIHIPGGIERLKKTVLHLAVSGKLVERQPSEGTGEDLYERVQTEKNKLINTGKIKKQKDLSGKRHVSFDIPMHWRWVRLGEIADYRKGPFGSSLTKAMFVPDGENSVKVYEQKNAIQKDKALGEYYITRDYYETKMKGFTVEPSDIIVSCAGTIGEIYVLPDDSPTGIINQALMRVRLFEPTNKQFYIFCLDKAITLNMDKAMGTAIKNIPPFEVLKNIHIPLPPLGEQIRIVEKVDEIFALIDELDAKYKAEEAERSKFVRASMRALSHDKYTPALDSLSQTIKTKADATELRKAILHLAVSGQLVPQDPTEGTGEELYKQIKADEITSKKPKELPPVVENKVPFDIPSAWKWVRLGDVTNYGSAEKSKPENIQKDTWVLELEDIEKSSSRLLSKVLASTRTSLSDKNVFRVGDVLYGKLRPYLDKVIVADDSGVCSSEILPIRSHGGNINPSYLLLLLKSPNFIAAVSDITYGVKMPRLGTEDGRRMLMPLPPLAEQKRILAKTTELLDLVTELEKHLEK